jgi:hypothetical protein
MPPETAVHLSSAQKRDLLGMSAAAMITTALIAAPMLLPREHAAPALVDPAIISASAVPTPALIQALTVRADDRGTSRPSTILKKRRDRAPLPSAPPRLASRRVAATAPVLVAMNTATSRPSKPLGKRLAGIFTGDGTYAVRPFPTIATERQ